MRHIVDAVDYLTKASQKRGQAPMIDSFQERVPLSHTIGTGTLGQPPRLRPSLKALAARVLEESRESVPLSHTEGAGTVGQAEANPSGPKIGRGGQWDAQDWRLYYEEKAGIAEHDGGLSRTEVEKRAYESCLIEWLWRDPPPASGPEHCAHCGRPLGEPGQDGVPFLTGDGGHVWLHDGCHGDWMARRRSEAVKALAVLGICSKHEAAICANCTA